MSKREKLLARIFTPPHPKDVRFDDLVTAMAGLGFVLCEQSGGSSHKYFVHSDSDLGDQRIDTSRPHPSGIMKVYQLKEVRERLVEWGYL